MTTMETGQLHATHERATNPWRQLKVYLAQWWAERTRRASRRQAIIRMAEMPDWQLRDIGLNRGDIERLIAEHRVVLDRVNSNPMQ